jgi:hypothetical protein
MWVPQFPLEDVLKMHADETAAATAAMASTLAIQTQIVAGCYKLRPCYKNAAMERYKNAAMERYKNAAMERYKNAAMEAIADIAATDHRRFQNGKSIKRCATQGFHLPKHQLRML